MFVLMYYIWETFRNKLKSILFQKLYWPFTVRTISETKCHYFYVYKEFVKWLNLELYIVIYVTEKKYFVMISTFCMPIMIVNLQCLNNCFRRHEQTSIRLIQSCSIYVTQKNRKKYFVMISTFCMPIMIVDLQCLNNCFKLVVFMLKKKSIL